MCGISGIFRPDRAPVEAERVRHMRDVMTSRGPDGEGLSSGPGYALGHRRLAIIDLSPGGAQPMQSADGRLDITFNGEIYNFTELRDLLVAKGRTFRTRSDTEVLLEGFLEWGLAGLLDKVRGMFALALVDRRDHVIHLARDPLGKKPLYYHFKDGALTFASSSRALLVGLDEAPAVDVGAVHDLLNGLFIPGPGSALRGILKVPPGRALSLNSEGDLKEHRHFTPSYYEPAFGVGVKDWDERVEEALKVAIRRRLVASDVPVGVLLSGGIDSGLITALAARESRDLQTFSVATDDPALDESPIAEEVARRCGTKHTTLRVRSDVRSALTRMIGGMGEPLADASAMNVFAISEVARQHVKVVLGGDGGDEMFGGYSHFWAYHMGDRVGALAPGRLLDLVARGAALFPPNNVAARRLATLVRTVRRPMAEAFSDLYLDAELRAALFSDASRAALAAHDPAHHVRAILGDESRGTRCQRVMLLQALTTLPDDYLAKVDGSTMAASLEARCPFLDLDLVRLAQTIPDEARFQGRKTKAILRRLYEKHLPGGAAFHKKRGFIAPVARWMRDWTDLVDDAILGPSIERRGIFRREGLERLVREHRAGHDRAYLLWGLLVLELWLRMAVDRTLLPGDPV